MIRIIDFKRAEPTCYRTNFPYASSGEQNGAFLVHSNTRNAPLLHPCHGSVLELWRTFPIGESAFQGPCSADSIVIGDVTLHNRMHTSPLAPQRLFRQMSGTTLSPGPVLSVRATSFLMTAVLRTLITREENNHVSLSAAQ